jgi:plasmid stability protein
LTDAYDLAKPKDDTLKTIAEIKRAATFGESITTAEARALLRALLSEPSETGAAVFAEWIQASVHRIEA